MYPNTQWQSNPLLVKEPSSLNLQPATPVQGPVQSSPTPSTAPSSSVVAPTVPAEPTVGQTLQGIKDKALGIQTILNTRAANEKSLTGLNYDTGPTYKELYPAINEKEVNRRQMKLFQGEIDATNRVYNDMLNQERLAGQGRLGSQTAMAARGGLLGSDFGEAQRQTQQNANLGAERAVENERLAKVGTIMGTMRKAVSDEIAAKRLARQEDAKSYIDYLAGAKTRKEANLKLAASSLIDAGIDPLTMDPSELDAIGKEANLSANDIITQYRQLKKEQEAAAAESGLKTRKTEAEISKINSDVENAGFFNLSEGQSRYDANGNVIASKGKTYAPGTGSGSSLSLTGDDKRSLIGGGWSESDIDAIENDVRTYGLTEAISNARANGASDSQITAMQKAYSADGAATPSKIDRNFLSTWYGIDDNNEGANSFLGFEWGETNSEQLDNLVATVERYKAVGMTDEEIYKKLEE